MIWLSILLVTACAVCWDVGVVLQKRAADALPPLSVGRGLGGTLKRFLTSPGWVGGMIVSAAGWGLFAWALDFTPVSLARSIQGSGFVVLALFSVAFLDHRLTPREWAGVVAVTAGVALLGLSEPAEAPSTFELVPAHFAIGLGSAVAVCLAIFAAGRIEAIGLKPVVAMSAIAGILLGLGDVLTRAIEVEAKHDVAVAFGLLGPLLVASYLTGFFILSRGYQHGRALVVTGVSDLAARLVALFVGVLAMDEALPAEPLLRAGRLAGFALILGGTVALAHFSAESLGAARDEAPDRGLGEVG